MKWRRAEERSSLRCFGDDCREEVFLQSLVHSSVCSSLEWLFKGLACFHLCGREGEKGERGERSSSDMKK